MLLPNTCKLLAGLLFSAFVFTSQAQSFPPVEIPGTQIRTLKSEIVNQEYVLHIYLPMGYAESGESYGVVYLLDSQWDFPLVQAIYGEQYYDGFLPKLIIVGITWGGEGADPNYLRIRDFSPTTIESLPQSGGAAKFMSFIQDELTPFIESEYRVKKNDRALMGSSLGGLFTLYAAFHETDFFQRYIPTSSAFGWDNGILFSYEEAYFQNNKKFPVRLYMAIGGVEPSVPDFKKFVSLLSDRNYRGFEMDSKILEGIGHSGCKAEGNTRGLQFVYQRNPVVLSAKDLSSRNGNYRSGDETVSLKIEGNQLVFISANGVQKPLLPEGLYRFYSPDSFFNLVFVRDTGGKVSGMTVETFGNKKEYVTVIE